MITLDAGALIAHERRDPKVLALLDGAERRGHGVLVPATVLAQVWRGARQVRLDRLLSAPTTQVVDLDRQAARAVGALLQISGTRDVVDAHVVVVARLHDAVVLTSDPDDLRHLDPRLAIRAL